MDGRLRFGFEASNLTPGQAGQRTSQILELGDIYPRAHILQNTAM